MARDPVVAWLLDPSQPAVRYRALTELVGLPESEPSVREARADIPRRGWAAEILAARDPGGWWVQSQDLYRPKYTSTHWRLLVLSDLGLTRANEAIASSCELWMRGTPMRNGGVGGNRAGTGHYCVVANMARALLRFGHEDDPRVLRSLEWLVEQADPKGGWSCFGRGRNLDSWEALAAFAAYPKRRWTRAMTEAVERGAEFYLERALHRQGGRYDPWFRFHYPTHYYYDLLVGLDMLTRLGYAKDPRLGVALEHLRRRRRRDGRWNLDAIHPDVDGGMARWYEAHPKDRPVPFGLETVGAPSRMITLTARCVLARVEA